MEKMLKLVNPLYAEEFCALVKKDGPVRYLSDERDAYWESIEEQSLSAAVRRPLLDEIEVDDEKSVSENYRAWRGALVAFSEIDHQLPDTVSQSKMIKVRKDMLKSIKEQPVGNPILHAYQERGLKALTELYPVLSNEKDQSMLI